MAQERFDIGDLVSRDGRDAWRITAIHPHEAECVCELPPAGWLRQDGTRGKAWCKEGDSARFQIIDLTPARPG